ncbi:hypothetical protein QWY85_02385 [Neolewinella lacunae]|uniref:Lipocalin-like domain-containing protein n=1 Tax=Neolewinella lacunae TaxID=1517758 RepID=A0A923T7I4_9BACT|nr:hypothetical protein [Neolewinella lacunae]MBC6993581.1 hypothetical protein [Neolewinella lacunae]MDN3633487.1 hypothetical protein [Neolewinella lacunae]
MRILSFPLAAAAALLLLTSCGPQEAAVTDPEPAVDISQALLGTWETVEIEINCPSYQGLDTTIQQTIREADWGQAFGVRPARTVFTPDGKLKRTHTLQNGEVTDVTNGLWKDLGKDSLLFIEPNKTLYYRYDLTGDRLVLTGLVDWDADGEKDDNYRSVLRLVGRTE